MTAAMTVPSSVLPVEGAVPGESPAGGLWSWTKVMCFEDCPYRFYLKYIAKLPQQPGFFASYGSFMHSLLASYLCSVFTAEELVTRYLTGFRAAVTRQAPSGKVFANYFRSGLAYLSGLSPPPCAPLWVEQRAEFRAGGVPLVGIADCLCEYGGKLYLIDHKSRSLKPRSGRKTPTAGDRELDGYFRQLYLYSIPASESFDYPPDFLCFNCFRTGQKLIEPYSADRAQEVEAWFAGRVAAILGAASFPPALDFFKCRYLCEMSGHCEYLPMFLGK